MGRLKNGTKTEPETKEPTKPKPRPKKANGYKFPEKLPKGEILRDSFKKEWKLGTSIGQGGFGEIYCGMFVFINVSNIYTTKG